MIIFGPRAKAVTEASNWAPPSLRRNGTHTQARANFSNLGATSSAKLTPSNIIAR